MDRQIINQIKSIINNMPTWLSIKGYTQCSGLSESTIRRAIQAGTLKANKVGGKWLIKASWLEKYLTS